MCAILAIDWAILDLARTSAQWLFAAVAQVAPSKRDEDVFQARAPRSDLAADPHLPADTHL